ncbi:MAG TPA: hypothetical protein P5556_07580 [Candidatus Gastranaerophilales bacterium]|nr:hypothetical protein [Candidatus Gastranaerophilales bacterium]
MKKLLKNKYIKLFLIAAIFVGLIFLALAKKQLQNQPSIEDIKQPAPAKVIGTPAVQGTLTTDVAKSIRADYPAGKNPDEAWKTFFFFIKNKQDNLNYGIFTEVTKLIYKNSEELNTVFFKGNVSEYQTKSYKILQKGNYAVIYFNNEKDEILSFPFLFCKTESGWKFDAVYQRKLVRIGDSAWGIEKTISPYSAILRKFPPYSGIDIPIEKKDVYKFSDDEELAKKIAGLEKLYLEGKLTFKKGVELGRLYSITSMEAKAIPLLEGVKKEMPKNPDINKYLAIAHVNYNYNYNSAKKEMESYVKLDSKDIFGHNFLAYLNIKTDKLDIAQVELDKTLKLDDKNCYAYEKLTRLYDKSYKNLPDDNVNKKIYQQKYLEMFDKAKKFCISENYERFIWLIQAKHGQG